MLFADERICLAPEMPENSLYQPRAFLFFGRRILRFDSVGPYQKYPVSCAVSTGCPMIFMI